MEEWRDIFDFKAAGIYCAFSIKVKGGKLELEDVYAPPGIDSSTLTPSEKVCILTEHSIYALARANWTQDALGIYLVPKMWNDKRHWGIMLRYVKCAATLINDFDPAYFLHKWSMRNYDLYNEAGNNDQYARCQINPEMAGESLTWLRNMARVGWQPDPTLVVEIWDLQRSLQQNMVSSLKLYLMMGPAIYGMIQTASGYP
jgi:hypothetical protein